MLWLKDYHQLEELHLSNCGLDNDSVLRLCQVLKDSNQLKFLGIDGYQYFDSDVEAGLARLLENNPELKIIFGKKLLPTALWSRTVWKVASFVTAILKQCAICLRFMVTQIFSRVATAKS